MGGFTPGYGLTAPLSDEERRRREQYGGFTARNAADSLTYSAERNAPGQQINPIEAGFAGFQERVADPNFVQNRANDMWEIAKQRQGENAVEYDSQGYPCNPFTKQRLPGPRRPELADPSVQSRP